jgi:hypothetical protein
VRVSERLRITGAFGPRARACVQVARLILDARAALRL